MNLDKVFQGVVQQYLCNSPRTNETIVENIFSFARALVFFDVNLVNRF